MKKLSWKVEKIEITSRLRWKNKNVELVNKKDDHTALILLGHFQPIKYKNFVKSKRKGVAKSILESFIVEEMGEGCNTIRRLPIVEIASEMTSGSPKNIYLKDNRTPWKINWAWCMNKI